MNNQDIPRDRRSEEFLAERLTGALGAIDALARERREAAVQAARIKIAAIHGAKRLRRRLDEPDARAA